MNEINAIELKVIDNSPQQMAWALCKYYFSMNCKNMEYAVIDLEELAEHILAYTRAERKMLEAEKR